MKTQKALALLLMSQFFLGGCSPEAPERGGLGDVSRPENLAMPERQAPVGDAAEASPEVAEPDSTAAPLDLSFRRPEDYRQAPADWPSLPDSENVNRFAPKEREEDRLKFKAKLRIKEEATLEGARNNYRDSLDGAEMGVEYRTR